MAANKILESQFIDDNHKKIALNIGHNLFVADVILDVDVGAFLSSISLGFKNPAGQLMPACTIKIPSIEAVQLAEAILASAKANKTDIKATQDEFNKLIK
jgi:hypothetical protein